MNPTGQKLCCFWIWPWNCRWLVVRFWQVFEVLNVLMIFKGTRWNKMEQAQSQLECRCASSVAWGRDSRSTWTRTTSHGALGHVGTFSECVKSDGLVHIQDDRGKNGSEGQFQTTYLQQLKPDTLILPKRYIEWMNEWNEMKWNEMK